MEETGDSLSGESFDWCSQQTQTGAYGSLTAGATANLPFTSNLTHYLSQDQNFERVPLGLPTTRPTGSSHTGQSSYSSRTSTRSGNNGSRI
ncbi:hypothetical protein MCOR27_005165 [Pyricularia oryzae]|uniref:Uncharacterized protein n=1 Tax=Pyricularia grisea TaxID=148305 RepID=A0ABQ8NNF7_PYRGI|nr:hypothetical protein MCOR01_000680 [Pyricularia oryzae]KAI6299735.1 hypothetical protein MCOR33_004437 [Pyricularia grisea]KAH9428560.1 hypothetical protein MCOR02_011108 [Pyricularia oryzae]KAI6279408.1 hypothetical protein MCOR27_005165 [Pyricularia oryzae]KAI6279491.1 hypothetical protein MCOR26_004218 [Pyricularia oryzae]